MTSWAASDRTVNTAFDAGPQYAWRLALLGGCAALAFGIVACSQTPSGGNVGTTPQGILTANPIDRYLINSHMAPNLARDADGGITLYIQHESPGKNREPNWLPAPKGPFFMVLREYWPKPEALNGSWTVPQAVRATQ